MDTLPSTTENEVLTVRWDGQDDAGGSGIAGYDTVPTLLEESTSSPLDWLHEFDLQDNTQSNSKPHAEQAVDALMELHSA